MNWRWWQRWRKAPAPEIEDRLPAIEKAAEWFIRSHDGLADHERREFLRWLKASPRHVTEILKFKALHSLLSVALQGFDEAKPTPPPSHQALSEPQKQLAEALRRLCLHEVGILRVLRSDADGPVIQAVTLPWVNLISEIERAPSLIYKLHWRRWEEIVAAAYELQGYEVILTPRSGDGGRDVIATRHDKGSIRIFDQVKAFAPGRLVTAADVYAMVGVLDIDPNVSKGCVTTTSDFAPGVYRDERLRRLRPFRLDLRPRDALLAWLSKVKKGLT